MQLVKVWVSLGDLGLYRIALNVQDWGVLAHTVRSGKYLNVLCVPEHTVFLKMRGREKREGVNTFESAAR